jgi:hypothetical protein
MSSSDGTFRTNVAPPRIHALSRRFGQWLERYSSQASHTPLLVLLTCGLYLLITLAGISFARSLGWYQALLVARFIWFITVAVVITYLLALLWLKRAYRSSFSVAMVLVSGLFSGLSYWLMQGEIMHVRQSLLSDLHNWRQNGLLITLPPFTRSHDTFYSQLLRDAVNKKVYQLPASLLDSQIKRINQAPVVPTLITRDSSFILGERDIHYLSLGNRLPLTHAFDSREAYLLLQSNQHTFAWPVNRSTTKLLLYIITGQSDWDDNVVWVFSDQLPLAQYRPSLAWLANGEWTTVRSNQILKLGKQLTK